MASINPFDRTVLANYIVVFREYSNYVHDRKDPGKIIDTLKRLGHSVELISKEKVYIEGVKNYNLGSLLNVSLFLIKRALFSRSKFFFFHIKRETVLLANLVLFTGEVVIKMDNCNRAGPYPWENWLNPRVEVNNLYYYKKLNVLVRNLYKYGVQRIFARTKLLSVEDVGTHQEYIKKYNITCKFEIVPNLVEPCKEILQKEKIILHVARIGDWSKNSELVVRSFLKSEIAKSYRLILVGSMTSEFKKWFSTLSKSNVEYAGMLNYMELSDLYRKAKFLYLPSEVETFANVFGESLSFGLNIITSINTALANYKLPGVTIVEEININTLTKTLDDLVYIDHEFVLKEYSRFYSKSNSFKIYG